MASVFDKLGTVYGRLTLQGKTVVEYASGKQTMAECLCICGKEVLVRLANLGKPTKSCGCLAKETGASVGRARKRHGMTNTPTYRSWCHMWERCTNENSPKYAAYKDRAPPERWKVFENFLADMGEGAKGLSLERVDNDKPYGPENCKWIPLSEQGSNTSRVRWVVKNGVELPLGQACDQERLDRRVVDSRLNKLGWDLEKALGYGWKWKDADVEVRQKTYVPQKDMSEPRLESVRKITLPPGL